MDIRANESKHKKHHIAALLFFQQKKEHNNTPRDSDTGFEWNIRIRIYHSCIDWKDKAWK